MGFNSHQKLTAESFDLTEPWERHPSETAKAFSAFISYRNLLPHKRSLTNAIKELHGSVSSSTLRQWKEWSSHYGWVWRSAAWDEEKDKISRAEHIKALSDMRSRHIKVAQALFQIGLSKLKDVKSEDLDIPLMLTLIEKGYKMERESMGSDEIVEAVAELSRTFSKEQISDDYSAVPTQELRQILTIRRRQSISGSNPILEDPDAKINE